MGPCPFRHGYRIEYWSDQRVEENGLQWGHALSGMDTIKSVDLPLSAALLQWGHALSGMDTVVSDSAGNTKLALQWGHALSGMDTHALRYPVLSFLMASMGPCPFRHGYLTMC